MRRRARGRAKARERRENGTPANPLPGAGDTVRKRPPPPARPKIPAEVMLQGPEEAVPPGAGGPDAVQRVGGWGGG